MMAASHHSICLVFFIFLCVPGISYSASPAPEQSEQLLTCFKCLANETRCHNTCTGKYCYKQEIQGKSITRVKRGCLNRTDALSRVDECTSRPQSLPGGLILTEKLCLCSTHRCNGGMPLTVSILSIAAAIVMFVR